MNYIGKMPNVFALYNFTLTFIFVGGGNKMSLVCQKITIQLKTNLEQVINTLSVVEFFVISS